MSMYTTGEIAKLCGVTVRTVQYYDSRNILTPSQLSEGGRRLYTEEDLNRMKTICFLRSMDLPINAIARLLEDEHPEETINLLLRQQEMELRAELRQNQEKLNKIAGLQKTLKSVEEFSFDSIGDAATILADKKKLQRVRWTVFAVGLPCDILQMATIALWIWKGIWWPFVFLWMPLSIGVAIWVSVYYARNVAYICPRCHQVFKPKLRDSFWARHTPSTRELTCRICEQKHFCVEIYHRR